MENCFITRLYGSTNNSSLLKFGEVRIFKKKVASPSKSTQQVPIKSAKNLTFKIIGNGYFTDSTLTQNYGTEYSGKEAYVSNDNVEISILSKYDINYISANETDVLNIDDLKYSQLYSALFSKGCSGNLEALENMTTIGALGLYSSTISGDIASLSKLTKLTSLTIAGTQVSGDIASLSGLTELTQLVVSDNKISGDIASLSKLTKLTSLTIAGTQVSGDIASLSGLTELTQINLRYSIVSGDIAKLPAKCRYVSFDDDKGVKKTWSSRDSNALILAISGSAKLDNVDKMLIDQSNCQIGFSSSDGLKYKTISVVGNRTSVSDSALSTLQNKGYTVSISPE